MNGLYLQLHAYMLRVAIPYGVLSSRQMRKLAHVARRYDRGYGHFTTRRNIQFNWPRLADVPDLLGELATVEMHAIQTSGNCIRNVTSDPFAGAAADEVEDPRVWCEIIRQWSTLHSEFSFLPRKFKIAVSGAVSDRAAVRFHDIGLILHRSDDGAIGFEVVVGGGQGRTPMIGHTIRPFVGKDHLLSYLEAIMRVYNQLGRRDNKYKARIKILVHETGAEAFADLVEAEWRHIQEEAPGLDLEPARIAAIDAYFAPPPFTTLEAVDPVHERARLAEPDFARWLRSNVADHQKTGYAIVSISLKAEGAVPGDATADQMDAVAELADRYAFGEIRVTHEQNLVLAHVRQADLYALWEELEAHALATANIDLVSDIIACPGLDYCSLASARSIPVAQAIGRRFADLDRQHDLGELRVKVSGCINACGHHHVGHIGILGVDRKGEEYYQITLGGAPGNDAAIGSIVGPSFSRHDVVDAVDTIIDTYVRIRSNGERFIDTYRRVGQDPFKETLYPAFPR